MHRNALQRRADVAAHELTRAAQLFDGTVKIDLIIRHFAATLGGVDLHRTDPAIHVDHVVSLRATCVERQLVQALFMVIEVERDGLEHPGSVVKGQLAQGRAADVTGIGQHRLNLQRVIAGLGDHIAGDSTCDVACTGAGVDPLSGGKALDIAHIGPLSDGRSQ